MPVLRSVVLFLLLALAPSAVSAVTVDQIVSLSKAGISEPIILALIERDKTVFTIEPEQLVALKRDGVSETVIIAMLKSGREEGEAAANAAAELNTAVIMSRLSPVPEVVIVGHGPDRPNTGYGNGYGYGYGYGPPIYDVPLFYDAPFFGIPSFGSRRSHRRSITTPFPPSTLTPLLPPPSLSSTGICIAHSTTVGAPPQVGSRGFVTSCPPGR